MTKQIQKVSVLFLISVFSFSAINEVFAQKDKPLIPVKPAESEKVAQPLQKLEVLKEEAENGGSSKSEAREEELKKARMEGRSKSGQSAGKPSKIEDFFLVLVNQNDPTSVGVFENDFSKLTGLTIQPMELNNGAYLVCGTKPEVALLRKAYASSITIFSESDLYNLTKVSSCFTELHIACIVKFKKIVSNQ